MAIPLDRVRSRRPRRIRTAIWGALTLLTCPCCIPLWILLLSGTAAGALLSRNIYLAVALFFIPFVFFAWKAIRSYGHDGDNTSEGQQADHSRISSS